MLKNILFVSFVFCLSLNTMAQTQPPPSSTKPVTPSNAPSGPSLQDGTPLKLRIAETVSSADAHPGQEVSFEVLEEVSVNNIVVIPKGGTAMATVTTAQSKKNMGRGGKLDINIDYVRLSDGEKVALRAVKDVKGGGHQGAMTGAMVGTAIVFFPAAPLFLFMHGKDITIPKGTEVTAFVSGNMPLDLAKFQPPTGVANPTTSASAPGATTELDLSSTPAGADISIDGNFVGNTPSSLSVAAGDHTISIKMVGYQSWDRTLHTVGGKVNLAATLVKTEANTPLSTAAQPSSVTDAARASKAKHTAAQSAVPQN